LRRMPPATDANLVRLTHTLLMLDERGLYHYQAALASLLSLQPRERTRETSNQISLLEAIADVPAQQIGHGPPLSLSEPEIIARVGNHALPLLVDTSASLSALSRSSAQKAGLAIRPVGYQIETALGRQIPADIAEGGLEFAGIRLHHVIFLVIPDASFGRLSRFGGIVGMPVLRAIGRIGFGTPRTGSREYVSSLAFIDGHPAVQAKLGGKLITCTLDTGATRSSISASLRQRAAAGPAKQLVIVKTAAGTRAMPLYETTLPVSVAGRTTSLNRAVILPGMDGAGSSLCNLGYDAVAAFEPLTFDFAGMRLILR
jgi:predicted aspartyl protease